MVRRHRLPALLLLLAATAALPAQTDGTQRWAFTTGGSIASSPAVGPDGTVYVGSQDNYLYALTSAGFMKWRYLTTDDVDSVPAVGADGTVYFGSWSGKLTALGPNGLKKWEYTTGSFLLSSPAIGADGVVYVGSGDFSLHAINADGTSRWKYLTSDWVDSSPAIAADGTVYFGCWDYSFYALTPTGELKWSYATGAEILSSPAIGTDGTVYVGSSDHKLYAFAPNGTKLWEFVTGASIESSPVVDADGSVYIASTDGKLYALTAAGALRWTYTSTSGLVSTPALRTGSLILGTSANSIVCLDTSNGSTRWTTTTGDWVDSSPLIVPNGTIYVGCLDRKLYSLTGNGQATPAGAPWPAFHRDPARQGQAAATAPAFTTSPASQTVTAGGSVTFTVVVTGSPAPTIQWQRAGADLAGATGLTLTLTNVQAADAATYRAVATNSAGTVTSTGAVLTVSPAAVPVILTEPQGHTVAAGGSVVLGAEVAGSGLSYQWRKDGAILSGATASQLLLSPAQAADAGSYTVTATSPAGAVTSRAAVLSVVATSDPGRLINVSVRIVSGTGADVLIMGFVTGGTGTSGTKPLLIRGIGPTLTSFGVPGAMADPILQLIPQGAAQPSESNDNWNGDATVLATANAVGAFPLPNAASLDAALVTRLAPGVFSAQVPGRNNTTGTVLAEIYDAQPATFDPAAPRLINISARAPMANDNPLIAGFVIGGATAKTVLIRAIGPFLAQFFAPGAAMSDPQLDLYVRQANSDRLLLTNDNWGGAALITRTGSSVGAFALPDPASRDAVLLVTLDPGVYSAKVTGVGNVSGITLVEIYEIP